MFHNYTLTYKITQALNHPQILSLLKQAEQAKENFNYTGDLSSDINWQRNAKRLADFLNFAGYNEENVSYQNIKDFIDSRTNLLYGEDEDWLQILQDFENEEKTNKEKSDFQIFSPTKMEQQEQGVHDLYYLDSAAQNKFRDDFRTAAQSKNFKGRNLDKDLALIQYYQNYPKPPIVRLDENGNPIEKKEPFGKHMDKIMPAVLSGRQDIRRIDNAQSVVGAQRWVDKHGFHDMYTVTNDDVDNDGIPDIIVKNKKGDPIIVNGYTTVDSTYPYRYKYYTAYPTAEDRKGYGKGFKGYVNDMWDPVYDENGMKITQYRNKAAAEKFYQDIKEKGHYSKKLKPNDKNIYQVFVSKVIKPLYDYTKFYNRGNYPGDRKMAKVASNVWSKIFVMAGMMYVYGENVVNVSLKQWNKLKAKEEVKNAIEHFAIPYIINGPEKVAEFFPLFAEAEGFTMDEGTLQGHQAAIIERMNKQQQAVQLPPQ